MKKSLIEEVAMEASNRRRFMRTLGIAGAAVAGGAAIPAKAASQNDINILNFALNLEYLEAEFYTVATTGKRIAQMGVGISGIGNPGPTTGGKKVTFDDTPNTPIFQSAVASEIAEDERDHVTLLRAALGSAAIAKPAINLDALGLGFANEKEFLALARAFEDLGVTAYAGAAPLIQDAAILGAAARILAIEAEHAGQLRLQVARLQVPTTALDGVDILPRPSGRRFISADNNGLAAVRTPGQVLYVAYGFKAHTTSGGFFPDGVNGNIKMSSARAS